MLPVLMFAQQIGVQSGAYDAVLLVGDTRSAQPLSWALGEVQVLYPPLDDGSQPAAAPSRCQEWTAACLLSMLPACRAGCRGHAPLLAPQCVPADGSQATALNLPSPAPPALPHLPCPALHTG
jgi:hypothetical protein